jgi:hypothetical protein
MVWCLWLDFVEVEFEESARWNNPFFLGIVFQIFGDEKTGASGDRGFIKRCIPRIVDTVCSRDSPVIGVRREIGLPLLVMTISCSAGEFEKLFFGLGQVDYHLNLEVGISASTGVDKTHRAHYTSSMSTIYRHTGSSRSTIALPETPIFDYVALVSSLSNYGRPRDRITRLLRQGSIVRLKKGLYCHAGAMESGALNREVVANLLYGPSYVSLVSALSIHGMIPEAVHNVTSVTTGKAKRFETAYGVFAYRALPAAYYWRGVELRRSSSFSSFLLATPEKALADTAFFTTGITSLDEAHHFLIDDMRIDEGALRSLDLPLFEWIAAGARKPALAGCAKALREIQGAGA